jgi:dolichol-phosphate mannosyltransferase
VFLGASLLTNWWSVLQLVAGCWAMLRIIRAARLAAPLDNETDIDVPIPTISVIIPARNEANRIRACLEAIVGAPGIHEVVVVDDESSDETAAVASRLGATVLSGKPLPNGWVGKAWALHQGVQAATGEWVVTLDADAVAHPQLAQAVVQRAQRDGLSFVSVGARFDCPSKGAQWLHPAMLTTLVYRYGPSGYKGKVKSDSQLANGQCMAFLRRDAIDHDVLTRVRGETIEDVALVRLVASMGWSVAMLDGSKLLTVRMFESFTDTWNGWGRSLSLASVDNVRRVFGHSIVLMLAQVAPLWMLVLGLSTPVSIALLLIRIGTLFGMRRAYVQHSLWYWLSPLADTLALVALFRGLIRQVFGRKATWRGRTYQQ